MQVVAALLLCTILPSPVAFSSLVSAAGVPTITAYALISCQYSGFVSFGSMLIYCVVGRCFITPNEFKHAKWSLGRWSRPLNFIAFVWNTYLAAILFSPLYFPVTGDSFNCECGKRDPHIEIGANLRQTLLSSLVPSPSLVSYPGGSFPKVNGFRRLDLERSMVPLLTKTSSFPELRGHGNFSCQAHLWKGAY